VELGGAQRRWGCNMLEGSGAERCMKEVGLEFLGRRWGWNL